MTNILHVSLAPSPSGTSAAALHTGPSTTSTSVAIDCVPGWQVVPSPDQGQSSVPYSVSAVSANDVWAVGMFGDIHLNKTEPLIEHWDGVSWAVVPYPNPEPTPLPLPLIYTPLASVAAVSANDVWAVGSFDTADSHPPLVEHWNGTAWNIVAGPTLAGTVDFFDGVAAISSGDVWAVGEFSPNLADQPLIEHWNGGSWTFVPSPSEGSGASLNAVSGVSSSDVWAVGYFSDDVGLWPLMERWNGATWMVSDYPRLGLLGNVLNGVAAVSANDVWAVGHQIEHWNGTSWSTVSYPDQGSSDTTLNGVAAASGDDIWAVGSITGGTDSGGHSSTLIEHWNGASWSAVSSPAHLSPDNSLQSVTTISANDAWAVGGSTDSSGYGHTLIEQFKQCPNDLKPAP